MRPPRLWTRLLEVVLPRRDRETLIPELGRLYRLRRQLGGRRRADGWYRREVAAFLLRLPLHRLRSQIPDEERPMTDRLLDLARELRQAARSLVAQPGVTVVAIVALVLGIGVNTLVFSVVDHVILRPLPYPEPDRLVAVWPESFPLRAEIGYFEENATTVEAIGSYYLEDGFNAELPDGSRRLSGNRISPSLLEVLGVQPILGRNFAPDARAPGRADVVLLSHGFWRSRFGADPKVVGAGLVLDGVRHEIVGVLPAGFAFPAEDQDVLVPYVMDPGDAGSYWGSGGYQAIARLRPGVRPQQLQQELLALSARTRELNPLWTPREDFRAEARVIPLRQAIVGDVRADLLVLLGAVGLVLLVACANVANLLLGRGMLRVQDTALRAALGAGRRRLIRQHLVESGVLIGLGSALALGLAWLSLDGMKALLPAEIPRVREISLDARVMAGTVAAALSIGLLASLVPALRATRVDGGRALRDGGHGPGTSAGRRRISSAMVVVQVAAAVVLVTGAGLLARSLGALGRVDPGFAVDGLTVATLTLTEREHETPRERVELFAQVARRVEALPDVAAAAVASHVPFGPGEGGIATFIEDVTPDPNSLPVISRVRVLPGYFSTMGIPLVSGRPIDRTDGPDTPLVAVVDETMAARYWPDESPVGKRIRYPWRGAPWIEIVGVVGGVADRDLGARRTPTYYVPLSQQPPYAATLVARGATGEAVAVGAIREVVERIDPATPISAAGPLRLRLSSSLARARWSTLLFTMFAALTLVLGCIGVYGVVAQSVGARTRDFGVQMALGAEPGRIRRRVLAEALRLALPGAVLGLLVAIPAARGLQSLLFGVPPTDPVTLTAVAIVLVVSTLVAAYVPARRATRIDPSEALRADA